MNSKKLSILIAIATVLFVYPLHAGAGTRKPASLTPKGQTESVYRKLANVDSKKSSTGQGMLMLQNTRESHPRFLSKNQRRGPVRVMGICRDGYGFAHLSNSRGYANCIEGGVNGSGANVTDFYGTSQRQAGVGIFIGAN